MTEERIAKITPCIWFATEGEEAATFYTGLLPDSRITNVIRSATDNPGGGRTGDVLLVEFDLAGQPFQALNGTAPATYTDAVSFSIACDDQAEVDRLWSAILDGGGQERACGWIVDRWGVRWQIVPRRLTALIADPDPAIARRASAAMMQMVKIDIAALERAVVG